MVQDHEFPVTAAMLRGTKISNLTGTQKYGETVPELLGKEHQEALDSLSKFEMVVEAKEKGWRDQIKFIGPPSSDSDLEEEEKDLTPPRSEEDPSRGDNVAQESEYARMAAVNARWESAARNPRKQTLKDIQEWVDEKLGYAGYIVCASDSPHGVTHLVWHTGFDQDTWKYKQELVNCELKVNFRVASSPTGTTRILTCDRCNAAQCRCGNWFLGPGLKCGKCKKGK